MKNSTTKTYTLSTILFLAFIFSMSGQLQNANWYFGNNTGLNFNDGTAPPTILTNSAMNSDGGVAVASDNLGNLLFYTNGITVWKNNHQTVYGSSLYGSTSVSQSVIIVPKIGYGKKFYIFTNQGNESGSQGLSYSILNMTQDDADDPYYYSLSSVNTQLLTHSSEKLTAVYNPNDNSYWVISFAPSNNPEVSDTFYTFKVDSYGVNLYTQSTFTFPFAPNTDFPGGQMKISRDGLSLAMAHNTVDKDNRYGIQNHTSLFIFDFDTFTGEVYNLNSSFNIANDLNYYGIEFSPDSNLLYVTSTHTMSNCNVYPVLEAEMGNLYQIPYRYQTQDNCGVTLYEGLDPIYSLQLGIDGKIYVANKSGNLSTINSPNTEGLGSNYVHDNIDLNGKGKYGLPQPIPLDHTEDIIFEQKVYSVLSNPFEESLNVEFYITASYDLKLYNIYGTMVKFREVQITSINQRISIDAENLSDGVYILTVQTQDNNNEIESTTVIKSDD